MPYLWTLKSQSWSSVSVGSTPTDSTNPSWLDSILVESENAEAVDTEGGLYDKMEKKEMHILKTVLQHLVDWLWWANGCNN